MSNILDMRGKKKKSTGDKWEAGNWLPRSPLGATRHGYQGGMTLGDGCRRHQRKIYPTEAALKKAILSMLPKGMRNITMTLRKSGRVYDCENAHLAVFSCFDLWVADIEVTKHVNGWSLTYPDDTIRSFTRELRNGYDMAETIHSFRDSENYPRKRPI